MSKIPTAEEFSKNFTRLRSAVALKDLSDFAVEFAKLHVQAALEAAAKKLPYDDKMNQDIFVKESILNAYSNENIK